MPHPIRFVFGIHLHQPTGNFDVVFQEHLEQVYRPFLERVAERGFLPIGLHLSGPLLEWLERHSPPFLDLVGNLASRGELELYLAGFHEPVLAVLPRQDRLEQIGWMRNYLTRRFGVAAEALWLTERVWEPQLAGDLAEAGVRSVLVDDRHFLVTGFRREELHRPYTTESEGRPLTLFPIDERLRYLIPFRPPEESAAYLRELSGRGHRLAVLADDGEKFGGWPGTREWVYEQGWLDRFLTTMAALLDGGEVSLVTLAQARKEVPGGGLAYLPTASYREMEEWSLPTAQARRLTSLERELGEERLRGPEGALIRGSHWRNFMVKYPEANRMHKKMWALSMAVRQAGDPQEARTAIGRAQCNDAYWHGVFGGLYLPHLRDAIWAELARAEGIIRQHEEPAWQELDIDCDGAVEIWLHGPAFSAIISPARGGVVEEFTVFEHLINYANVLTRRREPYHVARTEGADAGLHDAGGTPSIHDLEDRIRLNELPPIDPEERALVVERMLGGDLEADRYTRGDYDPSWTIRDHPVEIQMAGDATGVSSSARVVSGGVNVFEKSYRFHPDGRLEMEYRWRPEAFETGAVFAPEISLAGPCMITCTPEAPVWGYDIITVAKSERGLDQTIQGRSYTPRWPAEVGHAHIELDPTER